jgi:hypothetical protein
MKDCKEKSLLDVLSYCGLRELPEKDKKEYVWVHAVCLVEKRNGTKNYAVLRNGGENGCYICKDFGDISSIVKITSIYPYEFLNQDFMPCFKSSTKEERVDWLVNNGVKTDLSALSLKELEKLCVNIAIKRQLNQHH